MPASELERLDDRVLAARLAGGDVSAFEVIYERYRAPVFKVAMSVTGRRSAAEEATQDAFLSLWRKAHAYDPSRGGLGTFLFSIVRNRSIDWLRRETRHERNLQIDETTVDALEAAERTEQQAMARVESDDARQLVTKLPAQQRQVIELAYFKGLSHTEIATEVGIPLGTVKGRQRLALTKMRRTLTGTSGLGHRGVITEPDRRAPARLDRSLC